jgi:hypothetical protein
MRERTPASCTGPTIGPIRERADTLMHLRTCACAGVLRRPHHADARRDTRRARVTCPLCEAEERGCAAWTRDSETPPVT